jgi:hypothetical protein
LIFFTHILSPNGANIFIDPACVKGAGLINSSGFQQIGGAKLTGSGKKGEGPAAILELGQFSLVPA